jgi:hypothetical protein
MLIEWMAAPLKGARARSALLRRTGREVTSPGVTTRQGNRWSGHGLPAGVSFGENGNEIVGAFTGLRPSRVYRRGTHRRLRRLVGAGPPSALFSNWGGVAVTAYSGGYSQSSGFRYDGAAGAGDPCSESSPLSGARIIRGLPLQVAGPLFAATSEPECHVLAF